MLLRYHVVHSATLEELFVVLVSDIDIAKLQEETRAQASITPADHLQQLESLCARDDDPGQTSGIIQRVFDVAASIASSKGEVVTEALWTLLARFQEARSEMQQQAARGASNSFESSFGARAAAGTCSVILLFFLLFLFFDVSLSLLSIYYCLPACLL
jgi:hypothetical protein